MISGSRGEDRKGGTRAQATELLLRGSGVGWRRELVRAIFISLFIEMARALARAAGPYRIATVAQNRRILLCPFPLLPSENYGLLLSGFYVVLLAPRSSERRRQFCVPPLPLGVQFQPGPPAAQYLSSPATLRPERTIAGFGPCEASDSSVPIQ